MNIYHVEYISPMYDVDVHTAIITTSKNQTLAACLNVINTEVRGTVCIDTWKDGEMVDSFSWSVVSTEMSLIEEYMEKIHVQS